MKNKIALSVVLLSLVALPSCKWGKKEETVKTTVVTQMPHDKELAGYEDAGYDEEAGYSDDSRVQ